jgi:hypothetical protein
MLTEIEMQALERLLAGADARLAALRAQLERATVSSREMTGVGFFTHFSVPPEVPRLESGSRRIVIHDVYGEVDGLEHSAGFVLFVEDGIIGCLECFIVDGRWPESATLRRVYYVHPVAPGEATLVETKERDLKWAMDDAV